MGSPLFSPSMVNASASAQWRQIVRQHGADLRVSIPAMLSEDMDAATQTVTVQIVIQELTLSSGVFTTDNPAPPVSAAASSQAPPKVGPVWATLTPVQYVPVVLPRGGGFSQTLPLKKGDEGLLVFCDCCFDLWWKRGGVQNQVGDHRHEFWDCGFLPGMWSQPNRLNDYSNDSMQLRADDLSAYVDVAENVVTVSGGTNVDITAPAVSVGNGIDTPLALVNQTWLTWFTANVVPFLSGLGYSGPPEPAASATTVLKGL